MVVISEPRKVLVGEGLNKKYVLECTELHLGNKSIEKIRGFEDFVNLESLVICGNKLKKINNLDANSRIKILSAEDNQICTLKGSLSTFKFLEHLDLANNQLRDLTKQLKVLEKFQYLKHLNLKGNPFCEEPDYRMQVILAMPQVKVLDQHVVTPAERAKAKASLSSDATALTVAFGQRLPPKDLASTFASGKGVDDDNESGEGGRRGGSKLEEELAREAARVRELKLAREQEKEAALFQNNPHPEIPRGGKLPPNAGTTRANQFWAAKMQREDRLAARSTSIGTSGPVVQMISGKMVQKVSPPPPPLAHTSTQKASVAASTGGTSKTKSGGYGDVFVLAATRPPKTDLVKAGTTLHHMPHGPISFEKKRYENFVQSKAAGEGGWELTREEFKL